MNEKLYSISLNINNNTIIYVKYTSCTLVVLLLLLAFICFVNVNS